MSQNQHILQLKTFGEWLVTLEQLDPSLWTSPIAPGKWSISDIIAHIMNWDTYLVEHSLPAAKQGQPFLFPEYDTYNQRAIAYAGSGISQSNLIAEAKATRLLLVHSLEQMPESLLYRELSADGHTHCPYTGDAYSLNIIIRDFTHHDQHHKDQIQSFLSENHL